MKKNFVRGIAAFALVFGLVLSGCGDAAGEGTTEGNGEPKSITITGIDSKYKMAYLLVINQKKDAYNISIAMNMTGEPIVNGTVTLPLLDTNEYFNKDNEKTWTGTGSYYVRVSLESLGTFSVHYNTKTKVAITSTVTEIAFNSTNFEPLNASSPDLNDGDPKSIKITGIGGKYTHAFVMLKNNQADTVYVAGKSNSTTISGGSATMELLDFYTSTNTVWTGSGSYYVEIILSDNDTLNDHYITKSKVAVTSAVTEIAFNTSNFEVPGTGGSDPIGEPLPTPSGQNALSGKVYFDDRAKTTFSATSGTASGTYAWTTIKYDEGEQTLDNAGHYVYADYHTGTYSWNATAKTVTLKAEKAAWWEGTYS